MNEQKKRMTARLRAAIFEEASRFSQQITQAAVDFGRREAEIRRISHSSEGLPAREEALQVIKTTPH